MFDIFELLLFFVCISQSSFELEKTNWMCKISLDFCAVLNHNSLTVLVLEMAWKAHLRQATCCDITNVQEFQVKWADLHLHEQLTSFKALCWAVCSLSDPEELPLYSYLTYSDLPLFCMCMVFFKTEPFHLAFLCIHKCAWHIWKEGT